jgi:hypothetical protein
MEKLCTSENHSYKHHEQINKQNIDNSECFGVNDFTMKKFKIWFWLIIYGFFWHFPILLTDDCILFGLHFIGCHKGLN